jgi:GntR family transcriptional regulator
MRPAPVGRPDRAPSASGTIVSPRYHQVYVAIRAWLHDGNYRPGEQLPTEPQLCRLFGVSRITVRKAVAALEAEGRLERKQGRGTFVCAPRGEPPDPIDLRTVAHQISDLAARTTVRGFSVAEVMPDEDTRVALLLQPDERVRRALHVRELDGAPLGLITTFVPIDIAARLGEANEREQPMFVLLQSAGVPLMSADQYLGATLAGVEAAQALAVDVGAPLLRLDRVVKDDTGRPVERVVALYRADRYRYHLHLEARPSARRP